MFINQTLLGFGIEVPMLFISNITNRDSPSNSATYTHTNVSIGSPHPYRRIIVTSELSDNTGGTHSSVTVGGGSCTLLREHNTGGTTNSCVAIYITDAFVPTGTTAEIVINVTSASARNQIGVYRLIRPGGTSALHVNSVSADDPSITVNRGGGGATVAVTHFHTTGTGVPDTWVSVTSDFGTNVEGNAYGGAAHSSHEVSETAKTLSVNNPGTNTRSVLAAASFEVQSVMDV